MKDFRRTFIVKDYSDEWENSIKTSFVISVENNWLSVMHKNGREIYTSEIKAAFRRFLKEYEVEFSEKIAIYERKEYCRFCFHRDSSGYQYTYMKIDEDDGFPVRKFVMYESYLGRSDGFNCFVYDFLDLCVYSDFLINKDGFYGCHESEDADSELEMLHEKPKNSTRREENDKSDDGNTKPKNSSKKKTKNKSDNGDTSDEEIYIPLITYRNS